MPFDGYYDKESDAVATEADAFPDMNGIPKLDTGGSLAGRLRRRLLDR